MHLSPQQPIGIFDSGVGGLTVASAINQLLPHEQLIYFGDTAHTPWGTQSQASIQNYATRITKYLLNRNCKVIVVACNSASAAALKQVEAVAAGKALVYNVIDPVISYLQTNFQQHKVGLIGTKQTIQSNTYAKKLAAVTESIDLQCLATPIFVPLIEEGLGNTRYAEDFVQYYMSNPMFKNISALVLGCTHYPLIKEQMQIYFKQQVQIIDSAATVANLLAVDLAEKSLLNNLSTPQQEFFVSADSDFFVDLATKFFQDNINLTTYPLWEDQAVHLSETSS